MPLVGAVDDFDAVTERLEDPEPGIDAADAGVVAEIFAAALSFDAGFRSPAVGALSPGDLAPEVAGGSILAAIAELAAAVDFDTPCDDA